MQRRIFIALSKKYVYIIQQILPYTTVRYHSALKIQYAAGEPDRDIQRRIPRSTRQRWKQLSVHSFWMPGGTLHGERKQIRGMRVLLYLLKIQQYLLRSFPVKQHHIIPANDYLKNADKRLYNNNRKRFWKYLPFTYKQWAAWNSRKICAASLVQLCRRKHPAQLTLSEVTIIRDGCTGNRFRQWPLSSIYYQLLREQKINCSLSTFYKYCRLLHITKKPVRKKNTYNSISAAAPLRTLHMDVTLFKTVNGVKHYLYLIRDNYSKAILACKTTTVYSSEVAKETLQQVLERFGLMNSEGTLITDGGAENNGAVTQWLSKPGMLWKKIIAQVDIIQSNSIAEAANKILKYRYLFPNPVADTEEPIKVLNNALKDYNNMPQKNLCGLTPNEVLNGNIPDKHKFKMQIENARKRRVAVNQQIICNDDCSP